MCALFNGKGLRAEVRGFLRERAYGQNDVLQPYDLPVTRGECARAWVLRQLITDCARRGSRCSRRFRRAGPCRASALGSRRKCCSASRRRASNGKFRSSVLRGWSRFLMNKPHTNLGSTQKHCQACHRVQMRLGVCRQLVECHKWSNFASTKQLRSLHHNA